MKRAPHPPLRLWRGFARGACLALALVGAGASAQTTCTEGDGTWVASLCYVHDDASPFYGHSVLGDTPEWSLLRVELAASGRAVADGGHGIWEWRPQGFPDGALIFEDIAPRLADLDFDGQPEAIVVESSARFGARLAVYELVPSPAFVAATPYIGQRNRWLAPIGIADFNGDGQMDIAYVDRPHLARTLRVWSFVPGGLAGTGNLREIASLSGFSNHRIGEEFVTGGIRDCGQGPAMVLADAGWRHVMVARLQGGAIVAEAVAAFSPEATHAALACR